MKSDMPSYEKFKAYLSGEMSHDEQYQFERESMLDAFSEEALEGAYEISMDEFNADILELKKAIQKRTAKKRFIITNWYVAASIVTLLGLGFWGYFLIRTTSQHTVDDKIAMQADKSNNTLLSVPTVSENQHVAPGAPAAMLNEPTALQSGQSNTSKALKKNIELPKPEAGESDDISLKARVIESEATTDELSEVSSKEPYLNTYLATETFEKAESAEPIVKTDLIAGTGQENLIIIRDDTYLRGEENLNVLAKRRSTRGTELTNTNSNLARANLAHDALRVTPSESTMEINNGGMVYNSPNAGLYAEQSLADTISMAIPPFGDMNDYLNWMEKSLENTFDEFETNYIWLFLKIDEMGQVSIDSIQPSNIQSKKNNIEGVIRQAGLWTPARMGESTISDNRLVKIVKKN